MGKHEVRHSWYCENCGHRIVTAVNLRNRPITARFPPSAFFVMSRRRRYTDAPSVNCRSGAANDAMTLDRSNGEPPVAPMREVDFGVLSEGEIVGRIFCCKTASRVRGILLGHHSLAILKFAQPECCTSTTL